MVRRNLFLFIVVAVHLSCSSVNKTFDRAPAEVKRHLYTLHPDTSNPSFANGFRDPTGLVWGLEENPPSMSHYEAEKYCQEHQARLPTGPEMAYFQEFFQEAVKPIKPDAMPRKWLDAYPNYDIFNDFSTRKKYTFWLYYQNPLNNEWAQYHFFGLEWSAANYTERSRSQKVICVSGQGDLNIAAQITDKRPEPQVARPDLVSFTEDNSNPGFQNALRDPTGLVWARAPDRMTHKDAEEYCKDRQARLPSEVELRRFYAYNESRKRGSTVSWVAPWTGNRHPFREDLAVGFIGISGAEYLPRDSRKTVHCVFGEADPEKVALIQPPLPAAIVPKASEQPIEKTIEVLPNAVKILSTGVVMVEDKSNAAMPGAYRDPDGLIWGRLNKEASRAVAEQSCRKMGARLPLEEELTRLLTHIGLRNEVHWSLTAANGATPFLGAMKGATLWLGTNTRRFFNYYDLETKNVLFATDWSREYVCVSGSVPALWGGKEASDIVQSFVGKSCDPRILQGQWALTQAHCKDKIGTSARSFVPQQAFLEINSDSKSKSIYVDLVFQRDQRTIERGSSKPAKLTPVPGKACDLSYFYEGTINQLSSSKPGLYGIGKIGVDTKKDELLLEVDAREWTHFCLGIPAQNVVQQLVFKKIK